MICEKPLGSRTLVVTDLDGTVWDGTLACHRDTLDAIHVLLDRDDVELLVATGRRRNSARRAFDANGILLPSVLLNGAIGYDFAQEHIFHQATFSPADLTRIMSRLGEHQLGPVAYLTDTRAMVVEGVTTSVNHLDSLGDDLTWITVEDLVVRSDVLGMSMLGIEQATAEPAMEALHPVDGVEVAAYADHLYPPFSLMLAPEGVTKEVGIRAYLDYADITPERIIAIGDGGNDLEMLAMADVALAIEDSEPRAVAAADHLIGHPSVGGWAAVLDYV